MTRLFSLLLLLAAFSCSVVSHQDFKPGQEVLLYAYFKGKGDGLHLAYSTDGYKWAALKNDQLFLKPTAGQDKLMRDPCIIRGADNRFHMVWTVRLSKKPTAVCNLMKRKRLSYKELALLSDEIHTKYPARSGSISWR